ncbi:hypothetical protein ACA910_014456 [Epithemia clementina (nom. ined.)]
MRHNHNVLKVVLFVSGPGGDPNHYKPDRDETQWWSRRDALVRTVAAFLFGPSPKKDDDEKNKNDHEHGQCRRRELVLLFDQDLTRLHMSYRREPPSNTTLSSSSSSSTNHNHNPIVPTERTIVALWKQAAIAAAAATTSTKIENADDGAQDDDDDDSFSSGVVEQEGLSCRMVLHHDRTNVVATTTTTTTTIIINHQNKRELLDLLQQQCSLEFLRHYNLNCSSAVALRKVNRPRLVQIWHAWKKEKEQQQSQTKKKADDDDEDADKKKEKNKEALEAILLQLLQAPGMHSQQQPRNDGASPQPHHRHMIVAATLHESSDSELPCWNLSKSSCFNSNNKNNLSVCLFLGAVRDMTALEHECLQAAVHRAQTIPTLLCQVRLGPVAEFTSKILTVVAWHDATNVLGPALLQQRLQSHFTTQTNPSSRNNTPPPQPQCSSGNEQSTRSENNNTSSSSSKKKGTKRSRSQSHTMDSTMMAQASSPSVAVGRSTPGRPPPAVLHVIVLVPIDSHEVTTDLACRHGNRILWCLVRCTVVTLWRSRLAGAVAAAATSATALLQTSLTLVFANQVHLTLDQESLVQAMAEQHQAAPSEYQILHVLQQHLSQQQQQQQQQQRPTHAAAISSGIVRQLLPQTTKKTKKTNDSWSGSSFVLNLIPNDHHDPPTTSTLPPSVSDYFYSQHQPDTSSRDSDRPAPSSSSYTAIALLSIASSVGSTPMPRHNLQDPLTQAFAAAKVPVIPCTVLPASCFRSCQDWEAASITLLQHVAYQQRLFGFYECYCSSSFGFAHKNTKKTSSAKTKPKHNTKKKPKQS